MGMKYHLGLLLKTPMLTKRLCNKDKDKQPKKKENSQFASRFPTGLKKYHTLRMPPNKKIRSIKKKTIWKMLKFKGC